MKVKPEITEEIADLRDHPCYQALEDYLAACGMLLDKHIVSTLEDPLTANICRPFFTSLVMLPVWVGNFQEGQDSGKTNAEAFTYAWIKTGVEYAIYGTVYGATGLGVGLSVSLVGRYANSIIAKLEQHIETSPALYARSDCFFFNGTLGMEIPDPVEQLIKIVKVCQFTTGGLDYICTAVSDGAMYVASKLVSGVKTIDDYVKELADEMAKEQVVELIAKGIIDEPENKGIYVKSDALSIKPVVPVMTKPPAPDTSGGIEIIPGFDGKKVGVYAAKTSTSGVKGAVGIDLDLDTGLAVTGIISVPLEILTPILPALAIMAVTGGVAATLMNLWLTKKKYPYVKPRTMTKEELAEAVRPYDEQYSLLPQGQKNDVIDHLSKAFWFHMEIANDENRVIRHKKRWRAFRKLKKALRIKENNSHYLQDANKHETEARNIILNYWLEQQKNSALEEKESSNISSRTEKEYPIIETIIVNEGKTNVSDGFNQNLVAQIRYQVREIACRIVSDNQVYASIRPLIRIIDSQKSDSPYRQAVIAEIVREIIDVKSKKTLLEKALLYKQLLLLEPNPALYGEYAKVMEAIWLERIEAVFSKNPVDVLKHGGLDKFDQLVFDIDSIRFKAGSKDYEELIKLCQLSSTAPIDYENARKFMGLMLAELVDEVDVERKIICLILRGRVNNFLDQKGFAKADFYGAFCLNPDNLYCLKPLLALFCDEHGLIEEKDADVLSLSLNGICSLLEAYLQTKAYTKTLPGIEDMEVFYAFSIRYKRSDPSKSFGKLALVCEKMYQEISDFVEKIPVKQKQQLSSLKAQTFGLSSTTSGKYYGGGYHCIKGGLQPCTCGHGNICLCWYGATQALDDYKNKRTNGEKIDAPVRLLPADGSYTWNNGGSRTGNRVRYTEGFHDRKWMEERDGNYLNRLKREKEMREQQLQLREHILTGQVIDSVKTKGEKKKKFKLNKNSGTSGSKTSSTKRYITKLRKTTESSVASFYKYTHMGKSRTGTISGSLLGKKRSGVFYSDDMILKVFDSHVGRKQLSYYYKGREDSRLRIINSLFGSNHVSMRLDVEEAGILVHKREGNSYELYVNQEGRTVSVCGSVDCSKGRVPNENAITRNIHVALSQILYWQQTEIIAIRSHTIAFSYHVTGSHWCLGELSLVFNEHKTLMTTSIVTYNTTSIGGYEVNKRVRREIESEINSIFGSSIVLASTKNEAQKLKQTDGSSCGVFTSEYGKDVIDGVNTRRQQIVPSGTLPWRQQHVDDINDERFTELAETAEVDVPRVSASKLPSNMRDLMRELFEGISNIENTEDQKLMHDLLLNLASVTFQNRNVSNHYNLLRDLFLQHINIFKNICAVVVEEGSSRYTDQGQDILNFLIDEYGKYVQSFHDDEEIEEDGETEENNSGTQEKQVQTDYRYFPKNCNMSSYCRTVATQTMRVREESIDNAESNTYATIQDIQKLLSRLKGMREQGVPKGKKLKTTHKRKARRKSSGGKHFKGMSDLGIFKSDEIQRKRKKTKSSITGKGNVVKVVVGNQKILSMTIQYCCTGQSGSRFDYGMQISLYTLGSLEVLTHIHSSNSQISQSGIVLSQCTSLGMQVHKGLGIVHNAGYRCTLESNSYEELLEALIKLRTAVRGSVEQLFKDAIVKVEEKMKVVMENTSQGTFVHGYM